MPAMFNKIYAIASNTFTETIRQPIYGVLLWVAIGLLMLNPLLAAYTLESGANIKVMVDVALATMLLYGLLASVFSATSVITREIESHTVLTVVSKPVSRPLFLFGKFLGVVGAIFVGHFLLTVVFFMTARHGVMETVSDPYDLPVLVLSGVAVLISLIFALWCNFVYGWHFPSTLLAAVVPLGSLALLIVLFFNRKWEPQSPATDFGNFQLIYASLLVFCAVLILSAFAVTLSTRLSQVMTLTCCAGIYLLGLMSDYYFGLHRSEMWLYQALYSIAPNFQFFWVGDALTQDRMIDAFHVASVAGYAGVYALAVLSLGLALFQTREVG
jgi:ABC-2 type transport system permease protein